LTIPILPIYNRFMEKPGKTDPPTIESLQRELRDLAQCVHHLETRLAILEAHTAPEQEAIPSVIREVVAPASRGWKDTGGLLSYIGRLFIVMGGAYLLRALTEASTFSAGIGMTLGLLYSLVWAIATGRSAAQGRWWNGTFHGFAAALIAYPLIWESVTHFRILQSPLDVWLLAGITAAFFAVACRYRFQVLAWFAVAGSILTVLALLATTETFVPRTVFLIVLGITTLWLGYELEWRGLRWPAALAANFAVFGLMMRSLAAEPQESPAAALAVQLLLLIAYFTSVAIRTLIRARNVIPFEVVQVIASFMLGFVSAVYTARAATGVGTSLPGYAGLALGAACYAVAFAFIDSRIGRGKNFYFYTSLALLFALTGSGLLLTGPALSLAWTSLAVLMGWLGWRYNRIALTVHSTVSVLAAAIAGGLVIYMAKAFAGSAESAGGLPDTSQILTIIAAAVCVSFPFLQQADAGTKWLRLQRLAVIVLLVGGLGSMVVSLVGRWLGSMPPGGIDPGILATDRTVMLALSAILLAWISRYNRFAEWGWLVYPILIGTGLKILMEDLPRSRPATLFLAMGVYGFALILSPRLRRSPPAPNR